MNDDPRDPLFLRGVPVSLRALERMHEGVRSLEETSIGADVGMIGIADGRGAAFAFGTDISQAVSGTWAIITGQQAGTNFYSWAGVADEASGGGVSQKTDTTRWPWPAGLYNGQEGNGNTQVPVGAVVWMMPTNVEPTWKFFYPNPGASPLTQQVLNPYVPATQPSGTVDNWKPNPSGPVPAVVLVNPTGNVTLRGISPGSGAPTAGQVVYIVNISNFYITLKDGNVAGDTYPITLPGAGSVIILPQPAGGVNFGLMVVPLIFLPAVGWVLFGWALPPGLPNQRLVVNNAGTAPIWGGTILTKTTNYTVAVTDHLAEILCDASGGSFTITLSSAATYGADFLVTVKKIDSSAHTVTIAPNNAGTADTIEGHTDLVIANGAENQNYSITIACSGSNGAGAWRAVREYTAGDVSTLGDIWTSNGTGVAPSWQAPSTGMSNPMTTLGDLIYENATPAAARLAGDTSNSLVILTEQATGGTAQAPAWKTPAALGIPAAATIGAFPQWQKFTATWSGGGGTVIFNDSSMGQAQTLNLATFAKGVTISQLKWYVKTAFTGGGVSSFTFSLGYSSGGNGYTSNTTAYVSNQIAGSVPTPAVACATDAASFCANQDVGNWNLTVTGTPDPGHALSNLMAGEVDVWVLVGLAT